MQKQLGILLLGAVLLTSLVYLSGQSTTTGTNTEEQVVITLGKDLNEQQRQHVMNYFQSGGKIDEARIITVSNQEERKYLAGLVDESLIGTRAISSAYCEVTEPGRGIDVITYNINWVTPFMYANSLITAGIEDARIIVAAPFNVSGTAALTGIIKAFEVASGEKLTEEAKQTAHKEVAEMTNLGQKIGAERAQMLIYEVKQRVIEQNATTPEEIRNIIIEVTGELNINLNEKDINRIILLMQDISKLNINVSQLNDQLKTLRKHIGNLADSTEDAKGFIQRILNIIKALISNIEARITGVLLIKL